MSDEVTRQLAEACRAARADFDAINGYIAHATPRIHPYTITPKLLDSALAAHEAEQAQQSPVGGDNPTELPE